MCVRIQNGAEFIIKVAPHSTVAAAKELIGREMGLNPQQTPFGWLDEVNLVAGCYALEDSKTLWESKIVDLGSGPWLGYEALVTVSAEVARRTSPSPPKLKSQAVPRSCQGGLQAELQTAHAFSRVIRVQQCARRITALPRRAIEKLVAAAQAE